MLRNLFTVCMSSVLLLGCVSFDFRTLTRERQFAPTGWKQVSCSDIVPGATMRCYARIDTARDCAFLLSNIIYNDGVVIEWESFCSEISYPEVYLQKWTWLIVTKWLARGPFAIYKTINFLLYFLDAFFVCCYVVRDPDWLRGVFLYCIRACLQCTNDLPSRESRRAF